MAVIALGRSKPIEQGVCRFDPSRHLRGVTELIGVVFAGEMDAGGRSMLREMRMASQLSPLLGGMLSAAFFCDFMAGYVWIEAGQVVGNVTFQRADEYGGRWRISNVAVAPEHRRRGIARALMEATLQEIAERLGSWAVLQVRTDNTGARHLYEKLGFSDVCQDGVWWLKSPPNRLPAPDPALPLQPLRARDWRDRLDLAHAARSPLAHWAQPVEPASFRADLARLVGEALGNAIGLRLVRRWGHWRDGKLMGAVEIMTSASGGPDRLSFDVRPEARGALERTLIAQGLRVLSEHGFGSIIAGHSGDHSEGVAVLEAAGFCAQRILLTMRRQMSGPKGMEPKSLP